MFKIIIIICLIIIIYLMYYLNKYEGMTNKPKPNIMYVICGGARTFLKCFDSCYDKIINKLSPNYNISIFFYLKTVDIGPKGQEGWNFEYEDVEDYSIIKKIKSLKNVNVYYKILNGNEIDDSSLFKMVKDRSKYIDFYSEDSKLIRGMHQFYNLKKCGEFIVKLNIKFDTYVFIRPDLFFTVECEPIEKYSKDKVTIGRLGESTVNLDHIAIIPSKYFNNFFFDRIELFKNNTTKKYINSEEVYIATIPYEQQYIGEYYIKRD